MAPIDLVAALVNDELQRHQDRLIARRHKQARFRDPDRSLDGFDFAFEISPTCTPPSPSSSSATTGAGASRSWLIAHLSRHAKSTSYAKPRSPKLVSKKPGAVQTKVKTSASSQTPLAQVVRTIYAAPRASPERTAVRTMNRRHSFRVSLAVQP